MGLLSKWVHSEELQQIKTAYADLEADMKVVCEKLLKARLELKVMKLRHPGFSRDPKTGRFVANPK